jgi:hypothetical protein
MESSSSAQLPVQARRNIELRNAWQRFESHRRRVTGLLLQATPEPAGSIGILGAGNCNDLDLPALLGTFRRLQLVDWDGEALENGVERQGLAQHPAIHLHGGCELSGIAELVAKWSPQQPPTEQDLRSAAEIAAHAPLPLAVGSLAVAASIGLLSQILEPITALDTRHSEAWLQLIAAVRSRHLAILTEMIQPGGKAMLITDVVSSDTAPELRSTQPHDLPAVLTRLLNARNHFTGLSPAVVIDALRTRPGLSEQIATIEPLAPWLWDFGARQYAVYGVCWTRK